jgi:hypothetical protein
VSVNKSRITLKGRAARRQLPKNASEVSTMGVKELRKEVLEMTLAQYALLVFTQRLDQKVRKDMSLALHRRETATAHELRDFRDVLRKNLRHLSSEYGCRLTVRQLASEYNRLCKRRDAILYIHKWDIDEVYFTNYEKAWPGWQKRPPHMLIGLDFTGELTREYYLPEATLYEDMCFSYNSALSLEPELGKRPVDKSKVKAHAFFRRGAVLAAFYFVEAYLNGIAFDFSYRQGDKISQPELDLLREWDSKKSKEKWVKFRDKLLQYPKIILHAEHPPLTETNCPSLQIIVSEAREVRDSLVHWSPRPDTDSGSTIKTGWVIDMKKEKLTQVVDAAVTLVQQLNEKLGSHGQDLHWLHKRDGSGSFPQEAFE